MQQARGQGSDQVPGPAPGHAACPGAAGAPLFTCTARSALDPWGTAHVRATAGCVEQPTIPLRPWAAAARRVLSPSAARAIAHRGVPSAPSRTCAAVPTMSQHAASRKSARACAGPAPGVFMVGGHRTASCCCTVGDALPGAPDAVKRSGNSKIAYRGVVALATARRVGWEEGVGQPERWSERS